ncbi:MAG: transpeptidase family protein [Tannerellaceae bacterium]|jgi:cell division protein FtsI (penicillin-binding protein 3)|nr:transpeptidase family protein [Tannerellaceae bacterium]
MKDTDEPKNTIAISNKGILIRYALVCLLLFMVVAGIVFCILKITFVEKKEWLAIAEKERNKIPNRDIIPNRGNIYSADGRLMATSFPRYRILMDFRGAAIDTLAFYQKPKIPKGTIPDSTALANARKNGVDSLSFYLAKKFGLDESSVKQELKNALKKKKKRHVLYDKRISFSDLKEIKQFPFIRLGNSKSGFVEETFVERQHPFGTLASRTIGNVYGSLDSVGTSQGMYGLEMRFDSLLRGKPGLKSIRREAGVWREKPIIEAVNGMDIRSTIDIEIQDITEKALLNELRRTNAESGTIIVMEVKTGEIKAITNMGRTSSGYGEDKNRAIADLLEPGSTFKVASIMVALDDGICRPDDRIETGNGIYDYLKNGKPIRDHNANKEGYPNNISVEEAIWNSSNVGVSKVILKGYEHDPMKFIDGLYRIGLMEDLRIDIPGAGKPFMHKPGDKSWSKSSLPWLSFGYESGIPPIYTLTFYNAIANQGKMMRPIFVKEIMRDGKTVERFSPEVVRASICSGRTLRIIQDMLSGVVEHGTGKPAYSPLIRIAGKTGTAQIAEGGGYRGNGHQVSFVGYFPADHPVYSCIAVIRRPSPSFYPSGGAMSGSVVKNVAEKIYAAHTRLDIRKLPADSLAVLLPTSKAGEEKALRQVLDELDVDIDRKGVKSPWVLAVADDDKVKFRNINIREGQVPRVIGMGAKDAVYLLENAGLRVNMSGRGRVVSQSISPGQQITKGHTIAITLR